MEADWSVEIGADLPVIDGAWEGYVDLRNSPDSVALIDEARGYPALRDALLSLNDATSPVLTTKCDVWGLSEDEIDVDELGATNETARRGFASYIDIVEREPARFASFDFHEGWSRRIVAALHMADMRQSRVDVVVRQAYLGGQSGFGMTLYAAGCGATEAGSIVAWGAALSAAVAATIAAARPKHTGE